MMAGRKPDQTDRAISHVAVGIGVGMVGLKIGGPLGFVVGAVVGFIAHEALDAPLAAVVADLRGSS